MRFDDIFSGQNIPRLLEGLGVTLGVALSSAIISIILGFIFGLVLQTKNKAVRVIAKLFVEFFRMMPQLVLLYVFYFTIFKAIDPIVCSILVFSLWGIAEMGDLVRGAIDAVPIGQKEASKSIGLTYLMTNVKVIIPQIIPIIAPVSVNLITRMIKTTSLISLISAVDLLKVAGQIADFNTRFFHDKSSTLTMYLLAFILYFIVCYPLNLLEKKMMKSSKNN
jgi:polar amino acid transport system permease protein